jgi:hypothetical protein
MKKIVLACALMACMAATAQAQRKGSGFALGIKGGVNMTTLRTGPFIRDGQYDGQTLSENLSESWDSRNGLTGGVFMRFGRTLYFQPEVLYSGRGGTYNVQVLDNSGRPVGTPQAVKVNINSIDLPLLVGLKLGPLRAHAGPMASYIIDSNERVRDAIRRYTDEGADEAFNSAIWGYQIGGGLTLGSLTLDVRYENGLSNLRKNHTSTSSGNPFTQRTQGWQATLGFRIL